MRTFYIGIILILCSGVILILGLINKKNNFVGLWTVLKKHLKLFQNARFQYLLFYIVPLFMAIGISCIYIADCLMYQNIIVAVSIFVSMLLSMLSILTTKDYTKYTPEQQKKIKNVLDETNNAIVFCTFVSILIIIISLVMVAVSSSEEQILNRVVAAGIYYLIQVLLLNILLIVKRVGKLV